MGNLKWCPYCGGRHRKLAAARKCAKQHTRQAWTKEELGYGGKGKK